MSSVKGTESLNDYFGYLHYFLFTKSSLYNPEQFKESFGIIKIQELYFLFLQIDIFPCGPSSHAAKVFLQYGRKVSQQHKRGFLLVTHRGSFLLGTCCYATVPFARITPDKSFVEGGDFFNDYFTLHSTIPTLNDLKTKKSIENIVEKGKNAINSIFFHFTQCFLSFPK